MKFTIRQSIESYLETIKLARSPSTERAYRNALNAFRHDLVDNETDLENDISFLNEGSMISFISSLKDYSPATERLYITALAGYFEYLAAENLSDINLPRMRLLIRQRARRPGIRLPQFPRNDIEKCLIYANYLAIKPENDKFARLRNLRDRAFLLTLADTGLRVHEACNLRRGDIDWNEGKGIIIGKGNKEAVVRFSTRALEALHDYLNQRAQYDGASGRALSSLPVFSRHDKGAGRKVKPITTATGRNIVKQRVRESLGEEVAKNITPHSFRHYFVTTVLRGSGGNLKLAQELARHKNISVTQRYAHLSDDELDKGYYDIFDTGE